MATQVIRGKGNLYEANSERFITQVSYKVQEERAIDGTLAKWGGELTLTDSVKILDGDKYIIELDDKRKGRCSLKRRVNRAVILVPPRYMYLIRGTGPLG